MRSRIGSLARTGSITFSLPADTIADCTVILGPELDDDLDNGRPCAWQLIFTRLKNINQLDRLDAIVPPKDWWPAWHAGARKIVRKESLV